MEQSPKTLEELLYRCTVRVDAHGSPRGTGFFVAPGLILTCAHVVKGDTEEQPSRQQITVHWYGERHSAVIHRFLPNPYPDLALLKAVGMPSHPCVYLAGDIQLDDKLYSYGYAEGFLNGDPAYFDYEGLSHAPDFLKLKGGQASPGLSGAPLLNRRTGAICGIVKRTRDRRLDLGGYAVPSGTIYTRFGELASLQKEYHERHRMWMEFLPTGPKQKPATGSGVLQQPQQHAVSEEQLLDQTRSSGSAILKPYSMKIWHWPA